MSSKVIAIEGLPGTGKTSIATMLSRSLSIPVHTKDLLEAAIVRCKLSAPESLDGVGYKLLKVLALERIAVNQRRKNPSKHVSSYSNVLVPTIWTGQPAVTGSSC